MKLSNARHSILNHLKSEGQDKPKVQEIILKKHGITRVIYFKNYSKDDHLDKIIQSAGYKEVSNTEKIFETKEQPLNYVDNFRGRLIDHQEFVNLKDEEKKERLLQSTWLLKISYHSDLNEYFSSLDVYPSIYHPSQSVPGTSDLKDSIRHPLSFLRGRSVQNAVDEVFDVFKVGLVKAPSSKTIHYKIEKDGKFLVRLENEFDTLLSELSNEISSEFKKI